jgi:magnesium transporter
VRIAIVWREGLLAFISGEASVIDELKKRSAALERAENLGQVLYRFFDLLTGDDLVALERIEAQISALEKELNQSGQRDYVRQIVGFRTRLLALKRYYDHMRIICDELESNESHLVSGREMRYFHMLTGKVNRLYQSVITLSEYVSQVRETYQEQVDIRLNQVMKLFTVVATIFMPLTLIVGWYGMNLKMPEYGWSWGYPFVIGLCVAVTLMTVLLFKKNKWF